MPRSLKKKTRIDTRQAIIEAAGELFAIRGLDGTSIREIVRSAGTALCSVNYHFENKEQLYVECVRYVIQDRLDLEGALQVLDDPVPLSHDEIASLLTRVIRKMFFLFLNPENPFWYGILLIRAKQEFHPGVKPVITSITDPERVKNFLLRHIPDMDRNEAYLWVFNMVAQIQYYVVSKRTVLKTLGKKEYDDECLAMISDYTAGNLLKTLYLSKQDRGVEADGAGTMQG